MSLPQFEYQNPHSPIYGDDTSRDAQIAKGEAERKAVGAANQSPQQVNESAYAYLQRINGY